MSLKRSSSIFSYLNLPKQLLNAREYIEHKEIMELLNHYEKLSLTPLEKNLCYVAKYKCYILGGNTDKALNELNKINNSENFLVLKLFLKGVGYHLKEENKESSNFFNESLNALLAYGDGNYDCFKYMLTERMLDKPSLSECKHLSNTYDHLLQENKYTILEKEIFGTLEL